MNAASHQLMDPHQVSRVRRPTIDMKQHDRDAREKNGEPVKELYEITGPILTIRHVPVLERLTLEERGQLDHHIKKAEEIFRLARERFDHREHTQHIDQQEQKPVLKFPPSQAHTVWLPSQKPQEDDHEEISTKHHADRGTDTGQDASLAESERLSDQPTERSADRTEAIADARENGSEGNEVAKPLTNAEKAKARREKAKAKKLAEAAASAAEPEETGTSDSLAAAIAAGAIPDVDGD
jgi:hypothetical protein